MKTNEKIQSINDKYGTKVFGYSQQDLEIFTVPELTSLCESGMISDESKTIALMGRGL